jgi:hypothetical protein
MFPLSSLPALAGSRTLLLDSLVYLSSYPAFGAGPCEGHRTDAQTKYHAETGQLHNINDKRQIARIFRTRIGRE